MVTLSLLPLSNAPSVNASAASRHASSENRPLKTDRHSLMASWSPTTSHNPSVATMTISISSSKVIRSTSGVAVTPLFSGRLKSM